VVDRPPVKAVPVHTLVVCVQIDLGRVLAGDPVGGDHVQIRVAHQSLPQSLDTVVCHVRYLAPVSPSSTCLKGRLDENKLTSVVCPLFGRFFPHIHVDRVVVVLIIVHADIILSSRYETGSARCSRRG
jgi:hypothetical protein